MTSVTLVDANNASLEDPIVTSATSVSLEDASVILVAPTAASETLGDTSKSLEDARVASVTLGARSATRPAAQMIPHRINPGLTIRSGKESLSGQGKVPLPLVTSTIRRKVAAQPKTCALTLSHKTWHAGLVRAARSTMSPSLPACLRKPRLSSAPTSRQHQILPLRQEGALRVRPKTNWGCVFHIHKPH
jgi:hypothetical protein